MSSFLVFDSNNLVFSLLFILLIQISFFLIAVKFKTDKVTDLAYVSTFTLITIVLLLKVDKLSSTKLLLTFMVGLWGIRLSGYLFIRILKIGKDRRFDQMRESILKLGSFWLLQAVTIWIVLLPTILFISATPIDFSKVTLFGFLIWVAGFIIETVADMQKYKFKSNPKNKGKWINSGLWKLARHPNYFGEMLCWWGIYIYVLPLLAEVGHFSIISPIFITFLLRYVSGIPTLENKYKERYKGNLKFKKYKEGTRLLVPLPKL